MKRRYARDGKTITKHGYVRLTSGEFRFQYEHRAVAIRLAREFFYYGLVNGDLPDGWTVHHQDFDKQNNCPHNLLLIPLAFHQAAGTVHHREQERDEKGRFLPSWVIRQEEDRQGESGWEEGRE